MKGVNKLEAEIEAAFDRAVKLRDSGRIRKCTESDENLCMITTELRGAIIHTNLLKKHEIGREGNESDQTPVRNPKSKRR